MNRARTGQNRGCDGRDGDGRAQRGRPAGGLIAGGQRHGSKAKQCAIGRQGGMQTDTNRLGIDQGSINNPRSRPGTPGITARTPPGLIDWSETLTPLGHTNRQCLAVEVQAVRRAASAPPCISAPLALLSLPTSPLFPLPPSPVTLPKSCARARYSVSCLSPAS